MTATHFKDSAPAWWLEGPVCGSGSRRSSSESDVLHVGKASCRLDDVTGYRIGTTRARDNQGLLVAGLAFVAVAVMLLVGVAGFSWSERYFAVFGMLAVCGVISLLAAARVPPVPVYRLEIRVADGGSVSFTSGDPGELQRIVGLIEDARHAATPAVRWPLARAA